MAAVQTFPRDSFLPIGNIMPFTLRAPQNSKSLRVHTSACNSPGKTGFRMRTPGCRAVRTFASGCWQRLTGAEESRLEVEPRGREAVEGPWRLRLRGGVCARLGKAGEVGDSRQWGRLSWCARQRRRAPPVAAAGGSGPSGSGGEKGGLSTSTLNLLIGGLLLGLLVSGNLDFLDGVAQFVAGLLLTVVILVVLLIYGLEQMVSQNVGMGANTAGNCPWCGVGHKVLDVLAVHEGKPVPQQCLACQGVFTVENGMFVRASPKFYEDTDPMGSTRASSWSPASSQASSSQQWSQRKKGFGQKRSTKGKAPERTGVGPMYESLEEVVDIEAVVSDKD